MYHGYEIDYFGEGEPEVYGEPGDLKVQLRAVPHKKFERRGNDLYTNLTISLQDSLVGFSTSITHLDGHKVPIKRDGVTWHGFKMRVKNKGMPFLENNLTFGSLIITVSVDFPKTELSAEEKKVISDILKQDSRPEFFNGIHFGAKK